MNFDDLATDLIQSKYPVVSMFIVDHGQLCIHISERLSFRIADKRAKALRVGRPKTHDAVKIEKENEDEESAAQLSIQNNEDEGK